MIELQDNPPPMPTGQYSYVWDSDTQDFRPVQLLFSCDEYRVGEAAAFARGAEARRVQMQGEIDRLNLDEMTDEQRMDIFRNYCASCGSKDPHCRCWSDE